MNRQSNRAASRPTRRIGFALMAVALGVVVAFALAEAAARFYIYFIAEHGKLFQPDPEIGWVLIPDLDLDRRNGAGERWHIRTSERGFRTLADDFHPDAARRILIVGDSFAFGEGVQLEDRFDSRIASGHPDWSIVNQGVMGYGTDQQLIAARGDITKLRDGDVLLILSYLNDFVDLLQKSHSGRAKPWFELITGDLIAHPPRIGLAEHVRDQSYVLARTFSTLENDSNFTPAELRTSGHLYRRLIEQETGDAVARGVRVLIAYHGSSTLEMSMHALRRTAYESLTRLCEGPGIECVSVDRALTAAQESGLFQADGHWNAAGNAVAASTIEQALVTLLER